MKFSQTATNLLLSSTSESKRNNFTLDSREEVLFYTVAPFNVKRIFVQDCQTQSRCINGQVEDASVGVAHLFESKIVFSFEILTSF